MGPTHESRSRPAKSTAERSVSQAVSSVDPQRVRRTRTGLIAHDEKRAFNGYTLHADVR
jgi:hypothetical protein